MDLFLLNKMPVKHAHWSAFDRSSHPSYWHICVRTGLDRLDVAKILQQNSVNPINLRPGRGQLGSSAGSPPFLNN